MFLKIFIVCLIIIFIFSCLVFVIFLKSIENYYADVNILTSQLRSSIFISAVIITAISLIIALIFSRILSKPIKEINTAIRNLSSGNFKSKVFLRHKDELKELADSFNSMTEQMEVSFEELSRQKEELNSIVSSIQEGLLVLDSKGKILLSNDGFKKYFQVFIVDGKHYWEVIRGPYLGELIEKVTNKKGSEFLELVLHDKIFLCNAIFLDSRKEIIITFYDITEIRKLEKIKRDFVANLSHELRTPLTSIKGYAETLEEEIDEDEKLHYLDIIKRNTERLINIVQDLLLLSELEEKGATLQLADVNLKNMVEDVLRIFEQRLRDKKLDLKLDVDDKLPLIKADVFKLEQVFINIIDNAIKYTEKGFISISLKQKDDNVIIEIQDTGIGMTESHLSRIFERFYVVDKSHSKKLGGTGLGLSIVKHIVLLHNGKIDVESTYGFGTKFIITLPINV
jgi:two-component system, OmpR family, phosphate regulon sensor histidine kinase PhoR